MPTLRAGDVVRIRDERWIVCRHAAHRDTVVVDVRGHDRENRGVRARFMLPFEPIDRLPAVRTMRIVSPRRWRHLARQVLAGATPARESLRALASARLETHPFQLEPALAVVRGVAARILLADAVGLGKTIQAGLIVAETLARTADARALVVCPASLREQWSRELEQRFALEPVFVDSATLASPSLRTLPGANPWLAHVLVIASVDFVKRVEVLRGLEGAIWDVVVIDEAHRLAGRSDRHAAATLLAERARTLVMLTATPHSGNDENFRRLCRIGDLHPGFPLAVFHRTRQDVGLASSRRTTWLDVVPTPAERRMHEALMAYTRFVWQQQGGPSAAARLAMLVLLRRASSSAASLARSVERRLHFLTVPNDDDVTQPGLPFDVPDADDDEPGRELAAPGLNDAGTERARLHEILDLAQLAAAAESKVRAIRRYLARTVEPAIVFTEYRDTLATLAQQLGDVDCAELHGGCTAGERQRVLERFVAGNTRVLLATDAASEGLNLHRRCRLVIHLEVPWTPVRAEQRVGRVDRIGQPLRVHQLHLVAAGTSEQATVAPLVRRRASRALETMDALRPPPHAAQEIEHQLFGAEAASPPGERRSPPFPEGIVVVNLHETAVEEAAQCAAARRYAHGVHPGTVPIRPFGAALHRDCSHGIWVFHVGITDSEDELLWETLLGVTHAARCGQRQNAGTVSAFFERARERLLPVARAHHASLLERASNGLQQCVALGLAREQAILVALDVRQARLAASLLQPGLFDRRAERASTSQRVVLQEVVARCRARLTRLSRMQQPAAREPEPVFAVMLR